MPKKQELNDMHAIASLLVILIHVLSLGLSSLNTASWQAAMLFFPSRLASFVVPMFLYTGAIKMAQQFRNEQLSMRGYLRYILRRIWKIYVPYVLWVVIYYLCFLRIGYVNGDIREFFTAIFLGNLSAPFYYIVVVMQFYFLMPLWIFMVRRIPAHFAVGIGLLSMLCMEQGAYLLPMAGIPFSHGDLMFPSYLIYWLVGLYVGNSYEKAAPVLKQKRGMILCGAVIVFCAVPAYIQYAYNIYLFHLNAIKIVADLFSIVLLHHICFRLQGAPKKIRCLLQKLGRSSFFVYLSHCLFMTLATEFLLCKGIQAVSVQLSVRFLVSYTVPFAFCALWHRGINMAKGLRGSR